jgi:hypothetical protein
MRELIYVWTVLMLASASIRGQVAEPILTKSAIPFATGSGGVKLDYAGGIGQAGGGSQVIPEGILEVGLGGGLEVLTRFPLLRVTLQQQHETVIGGGQLAMGARYLLTGGADGPYAVSIQTIVETPTGDTRLVGNATQVMPTLLGYWRPSSRVVAYSNLTFDRSIGGTHSNSAFLEYEGAVTWSATAHLVPAIEVVGSTNTLLGRTQLVSLPEVILRMGRRLEGKAGLQVGLNSETPRLGLRIQLAWFWGNRH